jgi:hypothetical protein
VSNPVLIKEVEPGKKDGTPVPVRVSVVLAFALKE